jgi:hypothetical protein
MANILSNVLYDCLLRSFIFCSFLGVSIMCKRHGQHLTEVVHSVPRSRGICLGGKSLFRELSTL